MKNPENVANKRLKRKRLIASRVKCHGTKDSCAEAHPPKKKNTPVISQSVVDAVFKDIALQQEPWWKKLLRKIKIIK